MSQIACRIVDTVQEWQGPSCLLGSQAAVRPSRRQQAALQLSKSAGDAVGNTGCQRQPGKLWQRSPEESGDKLSAQHAECRGLGPVSRETLSGCLTPLQSPGNENLDIFVASDMKCHRRNMPFHYQLLLELKTTQKTPPVCFVLRVFFCLFFKQDSFKRP